jgi:hypothetical protein
VRSRVFAVNGVGEMVVGRTWQTQTLKSVAVGLDRVFQYSEETDKERENGTQVSSLIQITGIWLPNHFIFQLGRGG